uniref:Sulfotransferase family protein n=1 Tax=Ciona savignyi TaxID=51511 RepID=H2ZCA3_CIOSA
SVMKVIVAGYSKTGTKSMTSALRELGFTVYDFPEHFSEHKQQWKEILQSGNNPDIFREMYKDVDAVVDAPAFAYWKEIHEVFPDAKIILTSCEESPWFEKWQRQFENAASNPVYRLLTLLSPTAYQFNIHDYSLNKMMAIRIFRAHNADVVQNAPADKLLQFNVKQGWDPLCKFLEVPAPEKPFPHKNAGGTVLNDVIAEN